MQRSAAARLAQRIMRASETERLMLFEELRQKRNLSTSIGLLNSLLDTDQRELGETALQAFWMIVDSDRIDARNPSR